MEKRKVSYFWKGLSLFLVGLLLGVLIAPTENGVSIENNNNSVKCDTSGKADG